METQVPINAVKLKQLRESKSWSQEHLSIAAGVSLRTIQRMESTGNASAETRLAVAAALGVHVEILVNLNREEPTHKPPQAHGFRRGQIWAFGGVATGALCTSVVIIFSHFDGREIGISLGILGAVTGLASAFIGAFTQRCAHELRPNS